MRYVVLAFMAVACSSANSSGGPLAPGQVNANDPNAAMEPEPPLPPSGPSTLPPAPPESIKGCPQNREAPDVVLTGADDVRTRLAGVYRVCGGGTGIELRVDASSDTRLRWYLLDNRFVHLAGTGTSGMLDIGDCDGAVCIVDWQSDDRSTSSSSRELTVYEAPTAITITTDYSESVWTGYIRIAD